MGNSHVCIFTGQRRRSVAGSAMEKVTQHVYNTRSEWNAVYNVTLAQLQLQKAQEGTVIDEKALLSSCLALYTCALQSQRNCSI